MKKTDFTRHSIADLKEWNNANRLEIQPDFQRKDVWTLPAKIMLIDSILRDIPLPKIFIASKIKDNNPYRIVIDGQQRIKSILDFIADKFSLAPPYEGKYSNMHFNELPEQVRDKLLHYSLDFNEFKNYSDREMREIYNRVNKYTAVLNKQELRRADFPGDFLTLAEELSSIEYFDDARIFTPANRRRMGDVEYTSELLTIVLSGPQEKKYSLDDFYLNYREWDKKEKDACKKRFIQVIDDIQEIFPEDSFPIRSTRFKQKSDFYSLFAGVHNLQESGFIMHHDLVPDIQNDLKTINQRIAPGEQGVFGEYATRCLSDANSKSSREWRIDFISNFLVSLYNPTDASQERVRFFVNTLEDSEYNSLCSNAPDCTICGVTGSFDDNWTFMFPRGAIFIKQAVPVHRKCLASQPEDWVYVGED